MGVAVHQIRCLWREVDPCSESEVFSGFYSLRYLGSGRAKLYCNIKFSLHSSGIMKIGEITSHVETMDNMCKEVQWCNVMVYVVYCSQLWYRKCCDEVSGMGRVS